MHDSDETAKAAHESCMAIRAAEKQRKRDNAIQQPTEDE